MRVTWIFRFWLHEYWDVGHDRDSPRLRWQSSKGSHLSLQTNHSFVPRPPYCITLHCDKRRRSYLETLCINTPCLHFADLSRFIFTTNMNYTFLDVRSNFGVWHVFSFLFFSPNCNSRLVFPLLNVSLVCRYYIYSLFAKKRLARHKGVENHFLSSWDTIMTFMTSHTTFVTKMSFPVTGARLSDWLWLMSGSWIFEVAMSLWWGRRRKEDTISTPASNE